MLNLLDTSASVSEPWLHEYWMDFRRRFISLLSFQFKTFEASLGLAMLQMKHMKEATKKRTYIMLALKLILALRENLCKFVNLINLKSKKDFLRIKVRMR